MIIFHKKEPRDLSATYQKYCGQPLEGAHQALHDARAAKDILLGQLAYYGDIVETVEEFHLFCNDRRAEWIDDKGTLINTPDGPALGFGKYNGHLVSEIAKKDPGYLKRILGQDFDPEIKEIISKIVQEYD